MELCRLCNTPSSLFLVSKPCFACNNEELKLITSWNTFWFSLDSAPFAYNCFCERKCLLDLLNHTPFRTSDIGWSNSTFHWPWLSKPFAPAWVPSAHLVYSSEWPLFSLCAFQELCVFHASCAICYKNIGENTPKNWSIEVWWLETALLSLFSPSDRLVS